MVAVLNGESMSPKVPEKFIKRSGEAVPFNDEKIVKAVANAMLDVWEGDAQKATQINSLARSVTDSVIEAVSRRGFNAVYIEDVQDQVELELYRLQLPDIAKGYIEFRFKRKLERESSEAVERQEKLIHITNAKGEKTPLDGELLAALIGDACEGLEDVELNKVFDDTLKQLYDGIDEADVLDAAIMVARTFVEKEPNYNYVASRLLQAKLWKEALTFLTSRSSSPDFVKETGFILANEMAKIYPAYLETYIETGIELELLDPRLQDFDLEVLGKAIKPERDQLFTFLSMTTLYDRYFIHSEDTRFELPQMLFMRVAMGLALEEQDNREERVIEFYNLLSTFDYMSSTPTLFNAGTLRSQLSSCYLTTIPDDLECIYGGITKNALLQKYAGGLGNDWTPVRATGAVIKGTNGRSQGVIPFLKVANDTAVAVNQGGKRPGAVCAYLETWHLDIESFLDCRKNTGDDRIRTHDMNTANWIPDLFMKRVAEEGEWTLFTPNDVPDLHDLYGKAFEKRYVEYEGMAVKGEIKLSKRIKAVDLWRKMLTMVFETGHPWLTFKDPCNIRSPQQHAGVVHSSNLCTEITLNTSADEIAVCNLGSINLPQHITADGKLDMDKLQKTVRTAVRMLDNVIDINYYSVPEAKNSNLKHRPVGLGLMGFQDALYKLRVPYDSKEAIIFADESMEAISFLAIEASMLLARERGHYASFKGSLWSQGVLPIDSVEKLKEERGGYMSMDNQSRLGLDWENLRTAVKTDGMRNSNVMAIAPTATISNICGVSQSIEPLYQNLFVKSNRSGEFTVLNPYLVSDLKKRGLWNKTTVHGLKTPLQNSGPYQGIEGSVQEISDIPDELKELYKTAFEIDPKWLIEAAASRQKWIDQAQSLNLYCVQPSGRLLDSLYRLAWERGLKTTYYLRARGATAIEKSTARHAGSHNAVSVDDEPKVCSILDPDCEACQ